MLNEERAVAARIAAEVRRARKALGWSQLALAERARLSLNYVSLIERAEQVPTVRVLLQLAAALGVELRELVGGLGDESAEPDPWLREMTTLLRTLPVAARPIALAVLRGVAETTASLRVEEGSGVPARKKRRR